MKRLMQAAGFVALVAWTVLGAYAWSRAKEGLRVAIHEDGAGERSSELASLDDRVDALSGDLDALVASLDGNFGLLARAVESGGSADDVARARLEARETAGALSAVLARLESVAGTAGTEPGGAARVPLAPPAEAEAPEAHDRGLAAATSAGDGAPEGDGGDGAASAPASFLAFHLPSRDFRFEGEQTFEVLEDLSRVGFDAESTLHDFTGVSSAVRGRFRVDLAHPDAGIDGRIEVECASLRTGLGGRDEAMREHLATELFDRIAFEPTGFEPTEVDPDGMRVAGRLLGQMEIRGVTRDVRVEVTAHTDESRRLVVEGETPLSLGDFGAPVPSKLGVISMDDEVRVWVSLRLRARADEVSH